MFKRHPRIFTKPKPKWPISAQVGGEVIHGEAKDISPFGAFIRCRKPLNLNEIFDMVVDTPDKSLNIQAEVVWSNIYGPDDEISPRGMGVRFIKMPSEARKLIAQAALEHFKSADLEPELLQTLNTLVIDLSEEQKQVPSSGR